MKRQTTKQKKNQEHRNIATLSLQLRSYNKEIETRILFLNQQNPRNWRTEDGNANPPTGNRRPLSEVEGSGRWEV